MTPEELKNRTKQFAIAIVRFVRTLPHTTDCTVIGRQLLRAGTSVAANYRAACRARSKSDFISKITIIEEEADESLFWLEMLTEIEIASSPTSEKLMKEASELTAIFTSAGRTAKTHR